MSYKIFIAYEQTLLIGVRLLINLVRVPLQMTILWFSSYSYLTIVVNLVIEVNVEFNTFVIIW